MVTACALMPLKRTVPLRAPEPGSTPIRANPEALESVMGKTCADDIAAAILPPDTVTMTAAEVAVPLMLSVALAVSEWLPFVAMVLSQLTVYGALVTVPRDVVPSSRNWTLAMVYPIAAAALAVTATVPLTPAPFIGDVILTVGHATP